MRPPSGTVSNPRLTSPPNWEEQLIDPLERVAKHHRLSEKAESFTESVIREMTRKAMINNAINLSQGFPDFAAPAVVKQAAIDAINADINQYAITWGSKSIRDAIVAKFGEQTGLQIDSERELTVTCGATEAMIATLLALVNPGDEVVVFEPFYENYGPDSVLSGATPRYVSLKPPNWAMDISELEAAFNDNTKAVIINTPNNPTGKVFSLPELKEIARLCRQYDVIAITDEIYDQIIYGEPDAPLAHHSLMTIEGMRDRTVVINGMSKSYSVTGWRVGWTIAEPTITEAIRKVHDFLTVGAAAPLQEAGAIALSLPDSYYQELADDYRARRDLLCQALDKTGFGFTVPDGSYYVMASINAFGYPNDVAFADFLVEKIGVAVVPGSSFYSEAERGSQQVRFAFCKRRKTLEAAASRLAKLT
ncbi:MAG: aminotransferase class I/II-fold pyridoxal phosphate-dependent enzyme [Acidobacteriota bacterium]|nr:aminotransferase class I/II-fold pyridoxal phosphate-dependent enzyme [Acidobacteriota bacterium]